MKKMKDELDEFIITTHYSLMKQGFTVRNAIEGSVGIFFAFYFIYFSFRKQLWNLAIIILIFWSSVTRKA
jgi:hypothetical protein